MSFLIPDTFTASFNRLSGLYQMAVKASVFDLQIDPAGNGLQLHRIDKSKDPISGRRASTVTSAAAIAVKVTNHFGDESMKMFREQK